MMNNDLNDLLIQTLNEGVIVLNLKGTVTRVNRSVTLLFEKEVSVLFIPEQWTCGKHFVRIIRKWKLSHCWSV